MLSSEAPWRASKRPREWTLTALVVGLSAIVAGSLTVAVVPGVAPVGAAAPLEISAWAPYFSANAASSLAAHGAALSEITPFMFTVKSATDISYNANISTVRGDALVQSYKSAAAQNGSKPLIATVVDATGSQTMAQILADPVQRSAHEAALVTFAGGFSGIDLDYESFAFNDGRSTWPTTNGVAGTYDNWGTFLTELSATLHANGKMLEVSVPPIYDSAQTISSGYWVYNYPVMAQTVDRIKVMMYSYNVSQPGPNAPYAWVSKTMSLIKTVVPPSKLQLGVPAYGTDWVTKVDGSCPQQALLAGVTSKRSVTTANAAQAAANKGQVPARDMVARENTYSYIESYSGVDDNNIAVVCNLYRTVWYDDEQSVYERVQLAQSLGLAGVAIWALGYESASVWDAINAVQSGQAYTAPAPIAPSLKPPAVLRPRTPIDSSGPLPARYLDTRAGYKTADGLFAGQGRQPSDSVLEVQIAGRGPVPGGASAVTLNVTVLGQGTGYVTVYPCGVRPGTSSLNVKAGQTISNSVITKLSASGMICVYTQVAADVLIDVFNVLPAGAVAALDNPARLLDTRVGQPTIDGRASGAGMLLVNGVVEVPVAGRGGLSATATSAVLNVTAVDAVGNGFLTVWSCDGPRPTTSNVNFAKTAAIPNAVVTPLSAHGTVCVYSSNATNVIVDVFGQLSRQTFQPLGQAARLLDTRTGFSTSDARFNGIGKSDLNQITEIPVGGRAGLDPVPQVAILNVTVVDPETAGYITVYACGTARPPVSNVNFAAGQALPNLVVTSLSATGTVCIYTSTKSNVLIDVFGSLAQ